jgi:hypothetical protein
MKAANILIKLGKVKMFIEDSKKYKFTSREVRKL